MTNINETAPASSSSFTTSTLPMLAAHMSSDSDSVSPGRGSRTYSRPGAIRPGRRFPASCASAGSSRCSVEISGVSRSPFLSSSDRTPGWLCTIAVKSGVWKRELSPWRSRSGASASFSRLRKNHIIVIKSGNSLVPLQRSW